MPPGPVNPADQLRSRARAIRQLAAQLDGCAALDLHRRADESTWLGPTAQHCSASLLGMRASLLAAADDMRGAARRLEQRATLMDAPPVGAPR